MSYDISYLFWWLAAALVLGLVAGWLTDRRRRGEALFAGWRRWAIVAWAVGAVFAYFHWLPGRMGFWLETALLFSAAYFLGCFVGGWARQLIEGDEPVADKRLAAGAVAAATAGAAAKLSAAPIAAQPVAAPTPKPTAPAAPAAALAAKPANPPAPTPVAAPTPMAPLVATPATAKPVTPSAAPAAAAPPAPAAAAESGAAPPLLSAARDGKGDDLRRIHAIDGWTEGRLKALGIWHFGQIADWSPANARWVEHRLALHGRVGDEKWVSQARTLLTAPPPAASAAAPVKAAPAPAAAAAIAAPRQNYAVQAITGEGGKPVTLTGAIGGQGDDLTRIKAVSAREAGGLNALGVWHFAQIAGWTAANQAWVDGHIGSAGRVGRENWAGQAKGLVDGGASKVTMIPAPQPASAPGPSPSAASQAMGGAAAPAPSAHPEPAAMGAIEGEERHEGARPAGYVGPRGGKADDLKRIRGIGQQNEGRLHALGVWHFSQIAAWTHDNVKWVGSYLAFPGRIDREEWVAQAKVLAAGGLTDFAKRVDHGDVASSVGGAKEGEGNVADLSKVKPHG